MPYVDDEYIDFDPDKLAEALHSGKNIKPHFYDYEDSRTREQRIRQEGDAIDKVLRMKYNDTWRKYNDPTWTPTETPGLIPIGGMNMAMNQNALFGARQQPNLTPQNALLLPTQKKIG